MYATLVIQYFIYSETSLLLYLHGTLVNATIPRLVCLLRLLFSFSEAEEFLLNSKHNSWAIPSSLDEFTVWAQKLRFEIGDIIVVEYDPKSDSVLEVNAEDYKNCKKDNPIKSYEDGKSSLEVNRSGGFYFVSGADGHCEKGQRFVIEVLNEKHSSKALPQAPAPSPSTSSDDSDSPSSASAPVSAQKQKAKSDALRTTTFGILVAALSLFIATSLIFSFV